MDGKEEDWKDGRGDGWKIEVSGTDRVFHP